MKAFPFLIGLAAGLLFGLSAPLNKTILSQLGGFQLAGLLYIGAAAAFLPHILKNRRSELLALRHSGRIRYLAGIIVFGGILGPLFLMLGLKAAHAMSVSIWLNMELAATALLGILFFKEHMDRFSAVGVALTLGAGIIVTAQESSSGVLSGLFILAACIFWGIDNHLTAIIDGVSPKTVTFVKGLVGGVTNTAIGLALSGGQISVRYIPLALLVGIFSYGISIVLYVTSAQSLGATRSQILFSTAPFWGICGAYLLLGESLSRSVLIALPLLALGVAFTFVSSHSHAHHHRETVHSHLHRHDDGHHAHNHGRESSDAAGYHSHMHEHKAADHSHPHYPDIHHRHEH